MEIVNTDLSSLLEKVDMLKKSIVVSVSFVHLLLLIECNQMTLSKQSLQPPSSFNTNLDSDLRSNQNRFPVSSFFFSDSNFFPFFLFFFDFYSIY